MPFRPSKLTAPSPDLRGSAASRGYDATHRKLRKLILARDPICRGCESAVSTVAEHVVPLTCGGARLDPANLQGCCKSCADYKTNIEKTEPNFGRRLAESGALM